MARFLTAFHTSPSSRTTLTPCSSAVNADYSESHMIFNNRPSFSLSFNDSPSPSSPRVLKRQTTAAAFLNRGLHKKGGGAAAARLIDPRSTLEDPPTLRDTEDKLSKGASLTPMKWWRQGIRKGLGWNINASWPGISINCWERAVVGNEHDSGWCRPSPWWRLLLRRLRARTRSIVSSCLCIQKQAPLDLLYDPVSYSLNFDDGSYNNHHHSFLHGLHENCTHTVPPSSPRTRGS